MLYPIWKELPRPRFFPDDPQLVSLLDSNYDPALGYFKVRMERRHARDLRKGIFGPEGLRKVPDRSGGVMVLRLPKGWTLRVTYHPAHWAGHVIAEFIPANMGEWPPLPPEWPEDLAD
jgi:hypothetical protein